MLWLLSHGRVRGPLGSVDPNAVSEAERNVEKCAQQL